MLPAAPVRLSTTTGCPHLRVRKSPTRRGIASAVPPAGNGTMIFTDRVGYSCAPAGSVATSPASAAAARHCATARCRPPDGGSLDIIVFLLTLVRRPTTRSIDGDLGSRDHGRPELLAHADHLAHLLGRAAERLGFK